ncbi:MAG TPA: SRPBCC family protein [Acidimicrobiales bacterium]|nr:SRPBCC family protein [Acidimicrobiales bacterium]
MDLTATLDTDAPASTLFAWVDDLTTYPRWLDIVSRVVADPSGEAEAWIVDLRGRLGPLARTKRLRMVRSRREEERLVVFERQELDGRQHSAWVLQAELADDGDRRRLDMHLHYGGGLFGAVLERLLADEVRRSRDRLRDLAAAGPPGAPAPETGPGAGS